jgi:hypothetical protein
LSRRNLTERADSFCGLATAIRFIGNQLCPTLNSTLAIPLRWRCASESL